MEREPDYCTGVRDINLLNALYYCKGRSIPVAFELVVKPHPYCGFASQESFEYITGKGKHFIAALKNNRLVALSEDDKRNKRFVAVDELEFPDTVSCKAG